MSLSTVINTRSPAYRNLIATCTDDRILVESDFNDASCSTGQCWDMIQKIADVKGWPVEEEWVDDLASESWGVVRRLEHNWSLFRNGGHVITSVKKKPRN
jgi:hypothetical protein